MTPKVSSEAFDAFFAWAPWVVGLLIYFAFYLAKRHERSPVPVVSGPTFACARCGRRASHEHMLAQDHGGAVSYVCTDCSPQGAVT